MIKTSVKPAKNSSNTRTSRLPNMRSTLQSYLEAFLHPVGIKEVVPRVEKRGILTEMKRFKKDSIF